MSQTTDLPRRSFLDRFLKGGVVALVASILYPITRFMIPPESGEANVTQVKLPFTRTDIEASENKAMTFRFGRTLGLILMTPAGELRAVAATCTHLDCTIQHRPDLGVLWCACHNGRYDLEGKNISGPPPRPLELYAINEVGDEIFVSKGEGG